MSRPLRLEFAGALYHIISRANGRKAIYLEESDFERFLEIPDGNLSKGMRQLNGIINK